MKRTTNISCDIGDTQSHSHAGCHTCSTSHVPGLVRCDCLLSSDPPAEVPQKRGIYPLNKLKCDKWYTRDVAQSAVDSASHIESHVTPRCNRQLVPNIQVSDSYLRATRRHEKWRKHWILADFRYRMTRAAFGCDMRNWQETSTSSLGRNQLISCAFLRKRVSGSVNQLTSYQLVDREKSLMVNKLRNSGHECSHHVCEKRRKRVCP